MSYRYLSLVAIILVLLLTAGVSYFWGRVENMEAYGYVGAFLISLLASATLGFPVPALAVVFALGGILKYPLLLGLVVGVAETIGELAAYAMGVAGGAALSDKGGRSFHKLREWMMPRGGWLIVGLSAFPNPFFDVVAAMAGSLRYPLKRFILLCWAGKTVKGLTVALVVAWGLGFVLRWVELIRL